MTTITIPRKVTKGTELVVLSRKNYEKLLTKNIIVEYDPTAGERRVLAHARKNRAAGKFLTLNELKQKLGFTS